MIIEPSNISSTDSSNKMKILDEPPAYSEANRSKTVPSSSACGVQDKNLPDQPQSTLPTVDQVHIYNRKNDIKGVFYIDPSIPLLDTERHKNRIKGQRKHDPLPHASFRTRNNDIDLTLGTNGNIKHGSRANVSVFNMSKELKVNLLPIEPSQPRIALNAATKHGTIILFIPQNFSGIIRMQTHKGSLSILPALAKRIKVAKRTDREIVFMHDGVDDASTEANYCDLLTRTGKVIVGLRDEDQYQPSAGFWQRLVGRS